jgi:thiol-disulfide isomerase/thioredoxin
MNVVNFLSRYAKSLAGGPPASHTVRQGALLVLGAVFAGYTATAFPPQFLKLFEKPWMQYIIFLVLFSSNYWGESGLPKLYVFLDALLFTVLLQVAIHFSKKAYQQEDSNDTEQVLQPIEPEVELVEDDEIPEVEVVQTEAPLNGGKMELVIVHGASWCGWSKKQMDEFDAIKGELERNGVSVRQVEDKTPEGQQLSKQFGVDGFPASLVFNNRELVNKIGGYKPANALVAEVLQLKNGGQEPQAPQQKGAELVIVHGASWCGWSKKQMDEFPSIKSALESKGVKVREVEDRSPEGQKMSKQFGIDGYPGSLVFKNGNLVDKIGGYKPANALVQQVLSKL